MAKGQEPAHFEEEPVGNTGLQEERVGTCRSRPPFVSRLREAGNHDHHRLAKIRQLPYDIDKGHAINAAFAKGKIGHDHVRPEMAEDAQRRSWPDRASNLQMLMAQEVDVHLSTVDIAIDNEGAPAASGGDSYAHTHFQGPGRR
jgi:hypothetical protein